VVAACVKADYWLTGYSASAGGERPDRPGQLHGRAVRDAGLHRRSAVTLGAHKLKKKVKALTKKKWRVIVRFLGDGMGTRTSCLAQEQGADDRGQAARRCPP